MPPKVSVDEVSNNNDGILCYKGHPYTGKVVGENEHLGYITVEQGVITHLIMLHQNGSVAIDMNLSNQTTAFKDESGRQITKELFLTTYPHFEQMSDAWGEMERLN